MNVFKASAMGWAIRLSCFIGLTHTIAGQGFNDWANKQGREEMILIHAGKESEAIERYEKALKLPAQPLEALFGLAVAHARLGHGDTALDYVDRAVAAGLPFERFLAGPMEMLEPLYALPGFQRRKQHNSPLLIHGPMLGALSDRSARFWLRTARPCHVEVVVSQVGRNLYGKNPIKATGRAGESDDRTGLIEVRGLKANQLYTYQVKLDGGVVWEGHHFRTFPKKHHAAAFRLAFGGGAAFTPDYERIFTTIKSRQPLAFLQMGDNIYVDQPMLPSVQRYGYYRRQHSSPYRSLTASLNVTAIWDDHDFGDDDCWYGPDPNLPIFKRDVLRVFKENWNNHGYGQGEESPGCYHDFYIGDVHIIMLDGRYYRSDPKRIKDRSMLGPDQLQWLFRTLENSRGVFKVLASPVPFAAGVKPGSLDPWDGYPEEREAIFTHIHQHQIEGVVLLAADRHRSDAWRIDRPGAYPFYEFMSSRLTNQHLHPVMEGSLFGYNAKRSFGLVEFDTTLRDPELTYRIITIDDEAVYALKVRRSELSIP